MSFITEHCNYLISAQSILIKVSHQCRPGLDQYDVIQVRTSLDLV